MADLETFQNEEILLDVRNKLNAGLEAINALPNANDYSLLEDRIDTLEGGDLGSLAATVASLQATVAALQSQMNSANQLVFTTRDAFVEALPGLTLYVGLRVIADGFAYVYVGTTTKILDLPGFTPEKVHTPMHYGSIGEYKNRVSNRLYGWALSDKFATLAAARLVYPDANSLSETIDSHAFQRCADAIRDFPLVRSSGPWNQWSKTATARAMWMPRGIYVINRTVDFTGFGSDDPWEMKGDQAVILNQCVGETGFDLIGTGQCQMDGFKIINDLIRGVGCPRSAMLWGRDSSGAGAAGHKIGRIWIEGWSTLACIQNYAGESNEFDVLILRNSLDKHMSIMDYGSETAHPAPGDTVTWSGGSGTIVNASSSAHLISIRRIYGTTPPTNGQTITFQSNKTAVVSGVYTQPAGEGPDGRSYCLVQDGTNYWETNSQYATNAAKGDAASFTINMGRISCLHNGHGDGMWIANALNHWYRGYFTASGDGGAGITMFRTTWSSVSCENIHIWSSIESDGADEDPDTGIKCAVRFDAESPGMDIIVNNLIFVTHRPHYGYAVFLPESNVSSVEMRQLEYNSSILGRDSGQKLFDTPEKFSVYGATIKSGAIQDDFLNLEELANCSAVVFRRDDPIKFYGKVGVIDDGSVDSGRIEAYAPDGTTKDSYVELSGADSAVVFQGQQVLGTRKGHVVPTTITYGSNTPAQPGTTINVANGANPTPQELLALILDRLRWEAAMASRLAGHGIIDEVPE